MRHLRMLSQKHKSRFRRIAWGLSLLFGVIAIGLVWLAYFAPLPDSLSVPPDSYIQISRRDLNYYGGPYYEGTEFFFRGESNNSMNETAAWYDAHIRGLGSAKALLPNGGFKPIDSRDIRYREGAASDMEWAKIPPRPSNTGVLGVYYFQSTPTAIYIWQKGDKCIFEVFRVHRMQD